MAFKNQSEEITFNITHHTFLSLWSYANPINGSNGKELCDIMTLFDSNIAIFSIKERQLLTNSSKDIERWSRKVIDGSIRQIYGAEKTLNSATNIIKSNGTLGITLPPISNRNYFRIVVAIGSNGEIPIISRDYGKGFINIFSMETFSLIMNELDTAPDFFEYLTKKIFFLNKSSVFPLNKEEDFLTIYLSNNRNFPSVNNLLSITPGIWKTFNQSSEYKAKKNADLKSVIWDGLIETISHDALADELEFGPSLSDIELALRKMAAENRYYRRLLGQAFEEFLQKSNNKIESRLVISESKTIYVFLAKDINTTREDRTQELFNRCFIAKGKFRDYPVVIGIGTEKYIPNQGFSIDLIYLSKQIWTQEDQKIFTKIQTKESYFTGNEYNFSQDEYPFYFQ